MDAACQAPALKPGLSPLPERIRALPIDKRGYPIPWFVAYVDGQPEFRAMDGEKFVRALEEQRCWVCGQRLGTRACFVAGPMCGVNRTSAEPPSHLDCARWSACNCPFLNNPQMVRRENEAVNNATFRRDSAGLAIARNPGVTMLWVTRQFEVFPDPEGKPLIQMGEPERVEWYREGRLATKAEVIESIETGLPNLEAIARQEPGGLMALARCVDHLRRFLPKA